ncbi:MAG TPA: AAA family ATPase [Gaiellaceae bacterium]|nr:AAA family ATPase [Gaiellaceae bacterium]
MVGRERELAVLASFFDEEPAAHGLILTGEPGIGKTLLWEAGIEEARRRRLRVLSTRASDAETQISFSALIDLFDGVTSSDLAGLAAPQRQALEVALLRAAPTASAPRPGAVAVALLNALRALAERTPLLIAIDDVQWLDAPSAEALAFAARRVEPGAVRLLLTRRPGRPGGVERVVAARSAQLLRIGPLSLGAVRRILSDRLELRLPRQLLRRLVDSTLGNPLFVLEVGRQLTEEGLPVFGRPLPVPDAVEDMLGTRVARLPARSRRLLLAVALDGRLRVEELAQLADAAAVEDAVEAGLLIVDGDRVRASHPLLAAAARKRSRARDRRDLHGLLARMVVDEERRARHLALATDRQDEALGEIVAGAAATAFARGARTEAAELAEHALRLTPTGHETRTERLLTLGDYLVAAGDPQRVTELLLPELETLPAGAHRVRAYLILVGGLFGTNDELRSRLDRALGECGDDPGLRAAVLAELTLNDVSIEVVRIREAEKTALDVADATRRAGRSEDERWALFALGLARILRGCPIDDVRARFEEVSTAVFEVGSSPDRLIVKRLVWRGPLDHARSLLTGLAAIADERGEPWSYAWLRLDLCELELRAGGIQAAAKVLDEWADSTDRAAMPWPQYERCRALLGASRGLPAEAQRWAEAALARGDVVGGRWDQLETLRAQGIAALLAHEPARAVESLRTVWEHTTREGVEDPGAFPVAPDLVEALTDADGLDEARRLADRLRRLAEAQEHPWGLASAMRCEALVRVGACADDGSATTGLAEAAAAYDALGFRFDRARTLLLLGRAERRRRRWAAARTALEQAAAVFEEIGSPGWLGEARSELSRVGARRPSPPGALTAAERRVAELAAEGLANKEIAQAMFVSVKTVEKHLSRVYAKLGVRSRARLARLLGPA